MRFNNLVFILIFLALISAIAWADDSLISRPPTPEMKEVSAKVEADSPGAGDNATEKGQGDAVAANFDDEADTKEKALPGKSDTKIEKTATVKPEEEHLAADVAGTPQDMDALSLLSHLRTTFEIRKVQVDIAEKDKKLRELHTPVVLPQLSPIVSPQATQPRVKTAPVRPKVVAIQGVGGKLSAVLRTKEGLVTVRQGDKIGSGKVTCIEPDRVLVRYGSADTSLNFLE